MFDLLGVARCLVAVVLAAAALSATPAPPRAHAAAAVTVSGTVLDPAGNPVAGAEIWDGYRNGFLFGDDAADGYCAGRDDRAGLEPLAVTDSLGHFTFTCGSDFYAYAVDPAAGYANSYGQFVHDDGPSNLVLELRPLPPETVTVRGGVLDPDGLPGSATAYI